MLRSRARREGAPLSRVVSFGLSPCWVVGEVECEQGQGFLGPHFTVFPPVLSNRYSNHFHSLVADWHRPPHPPPPPHTGAILPANTGQGCFSVIISSLLEIPELKPVVQWKEPRNAREDAWDAWACVYSTLPGHALLTSSLAPLASVSDRRGPQMGQQSQGALLVQTVCSSL